MSPTMREISYPFLGRMHAKVREAFTRRIEAMERELEFLIRKEDQHLLAIRRHGWTNDRLRVVFALNSVYQQLLGPFQAAARGGPEGLGKHVPVRHGNSTFDSAKATEVQRALGDFYKVLRELDVSQTWLHANTCGDLVWLISTRSE